MLHIVLMILKILGILLLILFGLVLALIFAVLFVPVCYSAQGVKEGSHLSGKVRVSWLFSLLTARVRYQGGSPDMEIFVFGIPLLKVKRKFGNLRKKYSRREKKAGGEKAEKMEGTRAEPEALENGKCSSENDKTGLQKREPVSSTGNTETGDTGIKNIQTAKDPGRFMRIWMKIKTVFAAFFRIPTKVKTKIRKIRLTFKGFCDKIKQWCTFLELDTTRRAWKFLKGRGKLLFKHMLPRKVQGWLRFGFDDPSLTGQVLAAAGIFYPFYRDRFTLIPVFDGVVLEGEIKVKGRIVGGYLLWQALKVYRNQDVKKTYQRFQHKEA